MSEGGNEQRGEEEGSKAGREVGGGDKDWEGVRREGGMLSGD